MKYINDIKIGVFVISGLVLLVFGWAYLREFALHKQNTFTVVFDDVVGLNKGSFVWINGLRVGRVDNLILDTKENKVLVGTRIQIPKVDIPLDSMFYIRTSGYVGDKYLDIVIGMSNTYIMDGDVVVGEPAIDAFLSLERISKLISHLDPEIVGESIQEFAVSAKDLVKKADSVIENTDKIVRSLPRGDQLQLLVKDAHETVTRLNNAIEKTQNLVSDPTSQGNLDKILDQASIISNDLNETLKNANNIANNKLAFDNINDLLLRASKIITQLDEIRADPLIQNELRQTLSNTNEAAKKVAVTSDDLSMALRKRFLLPRLWFGRLLPKKEKSDEEVLN